MTLIAGVLGSAVLGQKNRELSSSNELLTKAVSSSELANRQTLNALRSLVDDVVINKFDEQPTLRPSERRFLDGVLVQYQAYAGLQDDSLESRAIRAEGLMQSGRIRLRLSNDVLALQDLRSASVLLAELFDDTDRPEYQIKLAKTLSDMSQALLRSGRLDEAEAIAERGIELCSRAGAVAAGDAAAPDSADNRAVRAACAELHRMRGTIQSRRHKWKDAVTSFSLAEQVLDQLLILDPGNADYQQALSTVSRSLSVSWSRTGDLAKQSAFSEQTMRLQQALADQFPDDPEYQSGLAYSIYSKSEGSRCFVQGTIQG